MTDKDRLDFALGLLDRTQAFHSRVEGRVATLLTLNLAMATITTVNLTKPILSTYWVGVAVFALVAMAAAFFWLILVSYSHLANKIRPSLLFFGDIARMTSDAYVSKAVAASIDYLTDDALCQIWRNSEILTMKLARTQRAFFATCCAILLWIVFLFGVTVQTGALPMLRG